MTDITQVSFSGPATATRPGTLRRIAALMALWHQRRVLAELDAARLEDIGITRHQARAEAARSIWDVPPGWRV